MSNDIFTKRMQKLMSNGSVGSLNVTNTNIIENKTFSNDQNYRIGMLYDWDMNELEEVEFKFEKIKTRTVEGTEVEYMIHFRPDYNPEFLYKDKYYKDDGKERLGFYIDVYDMSRKVYEKWLIISKDDRVAFDRYNALRCNWCFEWVYNGQYFNCLGCIREATDNSFNSSNSDDLGGTTVDGEFSMVLPTNKVTSNLLLGTKFMITDNLAYPQVYEVIKIKDTSPLGTTRAYLKQRVFNSHTDFIGIVNEHPENEFIFDLPLDDLPKEYGGKYHMICNCIKNKGLPPVQPPTDVLWKLVCDSKYLYVNGDTVVIEAIPLGETTASCAWHIFIDDVEYGASQLTDYFDMVIEKRKFSIKAINKDMAKYIVKIGVFNPVTEECYDSVEMEVKL